MRQNIPLRGKRPAVKGWEVVASWYDGMVGDTGSNTHTSVGIKTVLEMLSLQEEEKVLDIGCGQGVLASYINAKGGRYYGIDASKTLIEQAKARHQPQGQFYVGDATRLSSHKISSLAPFDSCVFLLSIQDISFADKALSQCCSLLRPGGKLVIFMNHPAFRVPRQSGWGEDARRKLVFRRIDSYLSNLDVPMRSHYTSHKTLTRSFHRPLSYYVNALSKARMMITRFDELPYAEINAHDAGKASIRAQMEIPQFLAILGTKV